MSKIDAAFARALANEGRGFGPAATGAPPKSPGATGSVIPLKPGDVHLGDADVGGPVGLSLAKVIDGRLLIQGVSGAGKSWTLRRLLEQTEGMVQQIVVDPEGEFRELGEKLGLVLVDGHRLDIATLATLASSVREHRASVLLDLSELGREEQMQALTAFLTALIEAPREHWHPALVSIDEAHIFAPWGGFTEATAVRRASIAALTDLMSRGRKRGLAGVLATQRLARLHKSVVSDALNFMIGQNTLDLDIRRAAETIGWDARKAFDRLPALEAGDFIASGPAFSRSPCVTRVGPLRVAHRGATPAIVPGSTLDKAAAARLLDVDALIAASKADADARAENAQPLGLRAIRGFIREPAFADAGRVWGALARLAPNGARVKDLAKHLNRSDAEIAAALALLDQYGAVEFSGDGDKRAARAAKDLLK